MPNSKKMVKAHAIQRITDDMKVVVVKKEQPFREGTIQAKKAEAVFSANGKTVGEVKALRKGLVDSWAIREMVNRKVIKVVKVAA